MATIREQSWLAAPADEVWKTVGDPAAVHEWVPSLRSCEMDGALRRCELSRGGVVVEEILVVDHGLRRIQYGVREGLPLEHHLGTVDAIEAGDARCLLVYSTDILPDSAAVPIRKAILSSLEVLEARFGTNPP
jgi:hypothetical protein